MKKRILVVSSCTGEKVYSPDNQLTIEDFSDKQRLLRRENELEAYRTTAGEMYTGGQHVDLMAGINEFRSAGGQIDLAILSAGYGMLKESDLVVPYEVTFNTMNSTRIRSWSQQLNIHNQLEDWIQEYDLVFFLLGDKYLQALNLPLQGNREQKLIFFAGQSSRSIVLCDDNHFMLGIGEKEASKLHRGLIRIKGYLFAQLLKFIKHDPQRYWENAYENPKVIRDYILGSFNSNTQVTLFDEGDKGDSNEEILPFFSELFPVSEPAPNYGTELKYYMPENDDRVDPNYDFEHDRVTPGRDPLLNDWYAHQFYAAPQYNGILISKVNIDKASKKKSDLVRDLGVRAFLRLPDNYPIMGDCGAFSYKDAYEPPYHVDEVIDYYESLGFDFGVSIDHLIVGPYEKNKQERERRFKVTLDNAADFFNKVQKGNFHFTPIGVAQGWDPESFREAVKELIRQGYTYVALGGLALEQSSKIYEILKGIAPIIPNSNFRMHLFGVARDMRVMKAFHKLGVTSFDSASPLRRAWLGSGHNYHTVEGKHYTAIRIPEASETRGRIKKMISEGKGSFGTFKRLEEQALESLRKYDKGLMDIESALRSILEYDELLGDRREDHEELYREVLRDRPWEACPCEICSKIGIEVVLFRGNNRNRRRGFHNTFAYFKQVTKLQKELFGPK